MPMKLLYCILDVKNAGIVFVNAICELRQIYLMISWHRNIHTYCYKAV